MLKHLILVPEQGLGNRIRAVASARRLCERRGALLTIVWKGYHKLFTEDPGVRYVSEVPGDFAGAIVVRHKLKKDGGAWHNRRVPADKHELIILHSGYTFGDLTESLPILEHRLLKWLPRPSQKILGAVEPLKARLKGAVGFHVRSTDNRIARELSPLSLHLQIAARIPMHKKVFLSTDHAENDRAFRELLGDRLVSASKNRGGFDGTPGSVDREKDFTDLLDLFLLAETEYLIGSAGSSFTRLAMLYNGSPKSRIIRKARFSFDALADKLRFLLLIQSLRENAQRDIMNS